ncbi:unnamed protein product [Vicia faba]|uniref:Uncharacterized protein n=1 Tax=Vicia faba TaxID=3906 RepID=A0AAV0YLW0_VICFA|nr:unnamed protein product [Vicia faba]
MVATTIEHNDDDYVSHMMNDIYCSPYILHFDKSDLAAGGNVLDVPLIYESIRNHHLIQKYFVDETQETNMINQDVDKDVSDIMSDMLETKSKIHKENDDVTPENNFVSDDDHVREDVEVDICSC